MPDFRRTDHIGDYFNMICPADSRLVFPEPFQIFFGNSIAFKFQMYPGGIRHYIIKILVHLPRFKHYCLGRRNIAGHPLNAEKRHQFFTEILSGCFQSQIFMVNGILTWSFLLRLSFTYLFRAFFHTASCSVSHV